MQETCTKSGHDYPVFTSADSSSICLFDSARPIFPHNTMDLNSSHEATPNNDRCPPSYSFDMAKIRFCIMKNALLFGLIRLRRIANDFAESKLSRMFDSKSDFFHWPPDYNLTTSIRSGCYVPSIYAERFLEWTRSHCSGEMLLPTTTNSCRKLYGPLILLSSQRYSIGDLPTVR